MGNIKYLDKITILDINAEDVSEETYDFLMENPTYKDCFVELNEDLINVSAILDEPDKFGIPNNETILAEMQELKELCDKNDAAYIRFIHP